MIATPFAPTKIYLLNLAHELWRRAADRMPPENILKYDEALIDALRTLNLLQPTEEASVYEAEMALSVEALNTCFDGQLALIGLPRWAQCGYPEIQLPETYAAALLATVVPDDVLPWVRAPFPAFMIEVPNALLSLDTEHGPSPVRLIMVLREPEGERWAYVAWTASSACLWRFGVKTAELLPPALPGCDLSEASIFPMAVTEHDERVASLLGRLIVNTCLAMSDPERVRQPKQRPVRPGRPRGSGRSSPLPRTTVFRVGKPVSQDFRPAIRDYVSGKKRTLSVQSLVAGHWKMQAHGPGYSLRKLIYVEPYWRGESEAPILVRPIKLG